MNYDGYGFDGLASAASWEVRPTTPIATTPLTLYRRRWWSFLPRLPGLWWWHYALHRRIRTRIESALAACWMTLMIVRCWHKAVFV